MTDNKNPFKEEKSTEEINEKTTEEKNIEQPQEEIQVDEENIQENQEEQKPNDEYKEKYEDLNNKYLRLAADFDNFRKRTQNEKEELVKYANCELLGKIAGVLDTFERADEHLKEIQDAKVIKESYEVAFKQLTDTLTKIGMEEMVCLGEKFDPSEHEAITQIPTDEYEPDCVANVMQKGYKFAGKVVRPALVGVAVKKD